MSTATPEMIERPAAHRIAVGAVGGAITVILVWIASLYGTDIPTSVAQSMTILVTAGVSLFVPDYMEAP